MRYPRARDLAVGATIVISTHHALCLGGEVLVDMQPCILASTTIEKDVGEVADAYLISELIKGHWGATQHTPAHTDGTLDLTHTASHGKCNVVYVGDTLTAEQKAQLQEYSRTFKARVVYFNGADTINDAEVQTRLGISQHYSSPLVLPTAIRLTEAASSTAKIIDGDAMMTDPTTLNLFARPTIQRDLAPPGGTTTRIAEYFDPSTLETQYFDDAISAAMVEWIGDDGLEELHIFFSMAWFDLGSWAWALHVMEWGNKGYFQGERRFYLGSMVDDLFLSTRVFDYDGEYNEGSEERLTEEDMQRYYDAQIKWNENFNAQVNTEFPFNGVGILSEVGSAFTDTLGFPDASITLLPKGEKMTDPVEPQHAEDWLETAVPGMAAEYNSGSWGADDLLTWVLENKDTFWWQSHTLTHMLRDNLGESDCSIEDSGNAQIAVLTGLFDSANYDWRSMTTPGITGLFNANCLASATSNLITCAPGDNTYDGVQTEVSLVSATNHYHSIYTTVETNGFDGFQILPRYATNVYYNCVTPDCLVEENEYIRRVVCGCSELDPSLDKGTCSECEDGNIQSMGTFENLMATEAEVSARQILAGRRDKYMFHQANVIPTTINGQENVSLLQYWHERIFETLRAYIKFPITSTKFDDLCENFARHEKLDASGVIITATIDSESGAISGFTMATEEDVGFVPFTVPEASCVSTDGLTVGDVTIYGTDKTYYLSTSESIVPVAPVAPSSSDLPAIATVTSTSYSLPENATDIMDPIMGDDGYHVGDMGDGA